MNMTVIGILFLMLWLGFGVEWRRRKKQKEEDFYIWFPRLKPRDND